MFQAKETFGDIAHLSPGAIRLEPLSTRATSKRSLLSITIVTEQRDIVAIDGGIGTRLVVVLVIVLQLSIYIVLLCKSSIVIERCIPYTTANPRVVVRTSTHV